MSGEKCGFFSHHGNSIHDAAAQTELADASKQDLCGRSPGSCGVGSDGCVERWARGRHCDSARQQRIAWPVTFARAGFAQRICAQGYRRSHRGGRAPCGVHRTDTARPQGHREMVMVSGLISFALVFSAQELVATIFGLFLWFFSLFMFRLMAKADPQMRPVYLRHRLYRRYYPARSTPFRVNGECHD